MKKIITTNLLIECSSKEEAFKVLDFLESTGETIKKEMFGYGNTWKYVGFYKTGKYWTIADKSSYFGSTVILSSIFFENYTKQECSLIPGQWYRLGDGTSNLNGDWWIKFKELDDDNYVKSDGYIRGNIFHDTIGGFGLIDMYSYTPIDVSEIQHLLPDWHVDKPKNPVDKYVKDEWYTLRHWGINSFVKYDYHKGNQIFFTECIRDGKHDVRRDWWSNSGHKLIKVDMNRVSEFLPESHPDKIVSIKNLESFSETVHLRDTYIEVESEEQAALVFDKLKSLGEPVKPHLITFVKGSWDKIQYNDYHEAWICAISCNKTCVYVSDFLKYYKTDPVYAILGDPIVKDKPLIEPVHSISVNLCTKKKTNKFKF